MRSSIRALAAALMAALCPVAAAQEAEGPEPVAPKGAKVVTNAQMLGVGAANILDTYISPERYTGIEARYVSHTVRSRENGHVSRLLLHIGSLSYVGDRSGNGDEVSGMYTFAYGVHYNWRFLSDRLTVRAGGQLEANAGFLYNTRNSNNPAQARLGLNISPSAAVTWGFRLGRHASQVSYEASFPLVGLMFSPNYGQSYYEMFSLGNYDHNVVPTTIGSTPSLRHTVALDFTLGRTSFRVGYMGDFRQARVNNLEYHEYSNMFMIGIVRRFNTTRIAP